MYEHIAGVILAGGQNRRFPGIKGFVDVQGAPLIQSHISLLGGLFGRTFIITNTPEAYFHLGVPLVGDVLPSRGPLTGIHAALLNAPGDAVFVIACDMPFAGRDMVALVCSRHVAATRAATIDATVPVCNGAPEPLFGVYRRQLIHRAQEAIISGKVSMRRFLGEIATHYVDEAVVRKTGPGCKTFVNINSMEDYEAVAREFSAS